MTKSLGRILLASSAAIGTSCVLIATLLYWRSHTPPRDFLIDEANYYLADSVAGHLHRPHAMIEFAWSEHPKGRIAFQTNNLGFREDRDTDMRKAGNSVRILVTGDSHTDGVVYNAESFPNLLEEKLNAASASTRFEVINGGVGYYTFQNYAGFLRRHLDLHPDYFIMAVYLGNDFMEGIQFATRRGQIPPQPRSLRYRLKLWRAPAPMLSQAGNQIVYFDTYPGMKEKSLDIARQQISDIQNVCLENNIQLRVVLLPSKLEVEEGAQRDAASSLGVTQVQMDINQALTRSLIDDLSRDRVLYLDLTDYLKDQKDSLFWNQDYHLNNKGHRVVAEAMFGWLGPSLIARSPTSARESR